LIAIAPQVDGQFILDPALESTEYTDIDDRCLLAPKTTGHRSRHNAEMRMYWHCRLAHVGFKALKILQNVVSDVPTMTGK
jgi:hypothetical protein